MSETELAIIWGGMAYGAGYLMGASNPGYEQSMLLMIVILTIVLLLMVLWRFRKIYKHFKMMHET